MQLQYTFLNMSYSLNTYIIWWKCWSWSVKLSLITQLITNAEFRVIFNKNTYVRQVVILYYTTANILQIFRMFDMEDYACTS